MAKKVVKTVQAQPSDERTQTSVPETDLRIPAALVRTALSAEQTLMSWIRTSLSLFTFGFSVTQFFYYLQEQQPGASLSTGPRRFGLALIWVGVLALVLAMTEYVQRVRTMKEQGLPEIPMTLLPIGSGVAVLGIGIAALVIVTMNWSL